MPFAWKGGHSDDERLSRSTCAVSWFGSAVGVKFAARCQVVSIFHTHVTVYPWETQGTVMRPVGLEDLVREQVRYAPPPERSCPAFADMSLAERRELGVCPGSARTYTFWERCPPVLFIIVNRVVRDRGRPDTYDRRRVVFQEEMCPVPGGPRYVFSGVVQHIGLSLRHGHYVAYCAVGDREYARFDDERVIPRAWATFAHQGDVQSGVYVFAYVRASEDPQDAPGFRAAPLSAAVQAGARGVRADGDGGGSQRGAGALLPSDPAGPSGGGAAGSDGRRASGSGSGSSGVAGSSGGGASGVGGEEKSPRSRKRARLLPGDGATERGQSAGAEGAHSSSREGRAFPAGEDAEEWRMFTPAVIAPDKCQARTWAKGCGGQCTGPMVSRENPFCLRHERMRVQYEDDG